MNEDESLYCVVLQFRDHEDVSILTEAKSEKEALENAQRTSNRINIEGVRDIELVDSWNSYDEYNSESGVHVYDGP